MNRFCHTIAMTKSSSLMDHDAQAVLNRLYLGLRDAQAAQSDNASKHATGPAQARTSELDSAFAALQDQWVSMDGARGSRCKSSQAEDPPSTSSQHSKTQAMSLLAPQRIRNEDASPDRRAHGGHPGPAEQTSQSQSPDPSANDTAALKSNGLVMRPRMSIDQQGSQPSVLASVEAVPQDLLLERDMTPECLLPPADRHNPLSVDPAKAGIGTAAEEYQSPAEKYYRDVGPFCVSVQAMSIKPQCPQGSLFKYSKHGCLTQSQR